MSGANAAALLAARGGANAITSLSQFATAQSSGTTVAWPASVQNGDLAVLFDFSTGGSTPTKVVPSNFTEIVLFGTPSSSVSRVVASLRICDGTETGNITGMASGGIGVGKNLHILRADVPIVSATAAGGQIETTGGNPASQTLLSGAGIAPLVNFAARGGAGNTFSVESPALVAKLTNSLINMVSGYRDYISAPVDNTFDATDAGSINWLASVYIEISG